MLLDHFRIIFLPFPLSPPLHIYRHMSRPHSLVGFQKLSSDPATPCGLVLAETHGELLGILENKERFRRKKTSDKKTFASEVNNLRSDIWRAVESFFLIKQFPNVGIPSSRVDITIKQMLHPSCWILIFCDFL